MSNVIGIDEVQFFDDCTVIVEKLSSMDTALLIASLDQIWILGANRRTNA